MHPSIPMPCRLTPSSSQLLTTLSTQIQAIRPIKAFYQTLQQYYLKLSKNISTLTYQMVLLKSIQNIDDLTMTQKILQLHDIKIQLEKDYNRMTKDLREMEKQLLRVQGQHKNMENCCEGEQRILEIQGQNSVRIRREGKEIEEDNIKLKVSIEKYYQMMKELEWTIQDRKRKNKMVEEEIENIQMKNQKVGLMNDEYRLCVEQICKKNGKLIEEGKCVEKEIEEYEGKIKDKRRRNKEITEKIIKQKGEIEGLTHRKTYVQSILKGEEENASKLDQSLCQYQAVLAQRKVELEALKQANIELEQGINKERQYQQRQREQKNRIKEYLLTLLSANQTLYNELQRYCEDDQKVQRAFDGKVCKLMALAADLNEKQVLRRFETNIDTNCYNRLRKQSCQDASISNSNTASSWQNRKGKI